MHFAQDHFPDRNQIRSYGPGEITINEEIIRQPVVVTPSQLVRDWATDFDSLAADQFAALAALEPELVVLGTGSKLRFPPPALTAGLLQKGIGVEVMDTAAACRTYNILMSEGRQVAAALLIA